MSFTKVWLFFVFMMRSSERIFTPEAERKTGRHTEGEQPTLLTMVDTRSLNMVGTRRWRGEQLA